MAAGRRTGCFPAGRCYAQRRATVPRAKESEAMEPAARADAGADEARNVIEFWREVGPERWFAHDEKLDRLCRERFVALHDAAASGALSAWEQRPEGAMALLILLDQMPRNMFRNTPRAWATDAMAQRIAAEAIARGFDHRVEPGMRQFFY